MPARHPQQLSSLQPGETKQWTIYLQQVTQIADIEKTFTELTNAPSFDIPQTTLEKGQPFRIGINGTQLQSLTITTPAGKQIKLANTRQLSYTPTAGPGQYLLTATSKNGKTTQAMISVRMPWSWYLRQAGNAALKYKQRASWNCESYYGFYSAYLSRIYFPDTAMLRQTDQRLKLVMDLMYNPQWIPTENPSRIQNHTTTMGILVDRYRATDDLKDLEAAATLADWIITNAQSKDGAYRNRHTHYTSVIYIAKSIMEVMEQEKPLTYDAIWKKRYERHYLSVKRAIDQLMGGLTGIDTEGEMTLEDGMISCTALQIGAFALLQNDPAEKKKYTDMMLQFLDMHDCLTQLVKPDSRERGGTLRFWEAQYDVMLANNMLTSPHGWTAWRIYATYYAYLLTGQERWLTETMNALGSCAQLIDNKTGELRWAFVTDPYINTLQTTDNFPNTHADLYNNNQFKTEEGKYKSLVVGEQYIPMISDWFNANSSDNDVHEIFKCMEEVAIKSGFVLQRTDGSLLCYNCKAVKHGDVIEVTPADKTVSHIHFNLSKKSIVRIKWSKGSYSLDKGLNWLKNPATVK